jgi:hypothetical protein
MMSSADRAAPIHSFMRSQRRHEVSGSRRLRHAGPRRAGTSPSGSRSARRNFRVETLISIRYTLADPVLRDRTVPARKRQFLPCKVAHALPLNPAGIRACLGFGPSGVHVVPRCGRDEPHKPPQRLSPSSPQAPRCPRLGGTDRSLPTPRPKLCPQPPTAPIFVEGNTVGVVLILFMALLSSRGISTPSYRLRRATPLLRPVRSESRAPMKAPLRARRERAGARCRSRAKGHSAVPIAH